MSNYCTAIYDMVGNVLADWSSHKYLYYNSDNSPISVTVDGKLTNIDKLLEDIVAESISKIFGTYYSQTFEYLIYINNFLIGLKRTGASRNYITSLLNLSPDAKFSHIRDNMYTHLIYKAQLMSNAYSLMSQTYSLSTDKIELYDFPHNFKTLTESLLNKYTILQAKSITVFALLTENQLAKNGNQPFRSISRFSSKSNFGEDSLTDSANNAKYSSYLTELSDELSKDQPDLELIKTLAAQANSITDTSGLDYTSTIIEINNMVSTLNTLTVGGNDLQLLRVPGVTTSTPVITAPPITPVITAPPSTPKNDLSMYLIPLVILIGLIILFYLMNKKKY
jgi:hypothetical protein